MSLAEKFSFANDIGIKSAHAANWRITEKKQTKKKQKKNTQIYINIWQTQRF